MKNKWHLIVFILTFIVVYPCQAFSAENSNSNHLTPPDEIKGEENGESLTLNEDLQVENLSIKQIETDELSFQVYKDTFVIPFSRAYNELENRQQTEIKFQFSIKQPLVSISNFKLNFGYTQKSFWQAYDQKKSSPFRETNYNPELFFESPEFSTAVGNMIGLFGYEHESNGEVVPYSRSWDRLYLRILYNFKGIGISYKIWYRLPEKDKESPEDAEGDDNPDIHEYYGSNEIILGYHFRNTLITVMSRLNVFHGKGAIQLDLSHPLPGSSIYGHFQYWNGYGESLIDYDRHLTKIGIGIMIRRSIY